MSFFIIHNAKSANLLISAYLLDGQNIKIVCRVSGYCKSVIIRWRYRYINTNEYCECLARQIYYDNDDYVPTSLKEVIITGGNSIKSYAFYYCTSLTSIVIPDSVTSLGRSCESLEV